MNLKIELDKILKDKKILSGKDNGIALRTKLKMDEKDKDDNTYEVIISKEVYSFNSSYFLGLFEDSIKKIGESKFREKYKFDCTPVIMENIEDGIKDALNNVNVLG